MRTATKRIPSADARRLILDGTATADLNVAGHLDLSGQAELRKLPAGLAVLSLNLAECVNLGSLPERLTVSHLRLDGCRNLSLPEGFSCDVLEFRNGPLRRLPVGLAVKQRLVLEGNDRLAALPEGLRVQSLDLRGCVRLTALPGSLDVAELILAGCIALSTWPGPTTLRLHRLDVSGCPNLGRLPEGLVVEDAVEVAGSGLRGLPESLAGVPLRWRGVLVSERIAFRPESLSANEVLTERNLETRRVMIERVGYDRLFGESDTVVVDADRDAGGERVLRRLAVPRDEDVTCLSVRCPSTGREYVLRVPPGMRTCRQAAAWLAGFEDPDEFQPVVET
jgi:hypothetical protein